MRYATKRQCVWSVCCKNMNRLLSSFLVGTCLCSSGLSMAPFWNVFENGTEDLGDFSTQSDNESWFLPDPPYPDSDQHQSTVAQSRSVPQAGDTVLPGQKVQQRRPRKKSNNLWSAEQDQRLSKLVAQYGTKDWKIIAVKEGVHTLGQCADRWELKLNPDIKMGNWTPEEDKVITDWVAKYGLKWVDLAKEMPGRTRKNCRGRWHNCLDPNINRGPWTQEEDELLLKLHEQYGNKWALMAKSFKGRTGEQLQARWTGTVCKRVDINARGQRYVKSDSKD